MSGAIDAGDFVALLQTAIPSAPATHDIEVLHCQTDGIKSAMATRARFVRSVCCKNLANRCRAAEIGFDGRNTRWRRRRWLTEDAIHDPGASDHR